MFFDMTYVPITSMVSLSVVRAGRQSRMTQIYPIFMMYIIIPAVQLYTVELICPLKFEGEENVVKCRVNKTAVMGAECLRVQAHVTFELQVGSSTFPLCYTPSFNSSNCSPDSRRNTSKCWCDGTDGQIFDYTLVYSANKSRDLGAQLLCKICFVPQKTWIPKEKESCKEMNFGISHSDGIQNSNSTPGVIITLMLALFITYDLIAGKQLYSILS